MQDIAEMTRGLIANYSQISEDAQKLFQTERVVIGKCPRCGESVYEGKKNYYCGNRSCQFVMWKNDRFFEERGKAFTPKIAAALLKDGKGKGKGSALHENRQKPMTGRCFWRYRRQVCELPRGTEGQKLKTASIGSVATLPAKSLTRRTCRAGDFLFGEAPNPLYQITAIERM